MMVCQLCGSNNINPPAVCPRGGGVHQWGDPPPAVEEVEEATRELRAVHAQVKRARERLEAEGKITGAVIAEVGGVALALALAVLERAAPAIIDAGVGFIEEKILG